MTRLINEQNIRTPQRIENRACNDPGILTTDMKPISYGLPSMRVMYQFVGACHFQNASKLSV
jgi:hypothetical protein